MEETTPRTTPGNAPGNTPGNKIENLSFEEAMRQLDEVVKRLESGQDKLDDALAFYERGVALRQYCAQKLTEAQSRIDRIEIAPNGQITVKPMEMAGAHNATG